nr:Rpn family recombination-promoting nuclease/putative transposase [uncultured Prevotella sp.]
MEQVEERYISLLTDFGFKRIFGSAPNKDLLICFLNSLFNGKQVVKDVSYLNPEHVGDVYTDRRAIFDVYCEGENGEKFIVEMQNAYQTYFKERSLFYSTFPIREQAPKGDDWDFKLNHVYTVALLNFNMYEDAFDKEKTRHHVQLCNTATHKISYDKQEFIYVVLAKFNKTLGELETLYEKWLYALKNLYKLSQRPKELCDKVFDRLFEEAEIAKFSPLEMREYEASKKAYRDIKNSVDTAKREGIAEGMEKGMKQGMEKGMKQGMEKGMKQGMKQGMEKGMKQGMEKGLEQRSLEIARKMLAKGMDAASVMEITGLSAEQMQQLKA